jgi:hypothetical protein
MRSMKHKNILFLICISLIFSCNKNKEFLALDPLSQYSDVAVWRDPALVNAFVTDIYKNNFGSPFGMKRLSDFVDESRTNWSPTINFNKSLINADDLAEWGSDFSVQTLMMSWNAQYANIRRENLFFARIDDVPTTNENWVSGIKGEVYFHRALSYHYLTALYGGVPLITKVYTLDDEFKVVRSSYEDCVNYIIGQLDSAIALLPLLQDGGNQGRITQGAAMALKARVLLYAASDLRNPDKNGVVTAGYAHPELVGYTSGDAIVRWTAARDAAKAVMDLGMYDLYKKTPAPTDSIAQNIEDYFLSYGTEEDILLQYFNPATDEGWLNYRPALATMPNGYNSWGNQTPFSELVDDYEMKDGTRFDWNNSIEKQDPYANREARFYATILYEGAPYRPRPDGVQDIDPFNKIQVGMVVDVSGNILKGGVDTRFGPINTANGGHTGYYTKKFIDPKSPMQFVAQDAQNVPFRWFRYGEILLNYAEACIELGQDGDARTSINLIRARAGQPDVTVSGIQLKTAYRHERRIEMAYENQRFWDVRRWLIGADAYHQMHGVDVKYVANQASVPNYRKPDGSTWSVPQFNLVESPEDSRVWINKAYLLPIKRDELNKNDQLVQNPGY